MYHAQNYAGIIGSRQAASYMHTCMVQHLLLATVAIAIYEARSYT